MRASHWKPHSLGFALEPKTRRKAPQPFLKSARHNFKDDEVKTVRAMKLRKHPSPRPSPHRMGRGRLSPAQESAPARQLPPAGESAPARWSPSGEHSLECHVFPLSPSDGERAGVR